MSIPTMRPRALVLTAATATAMVLAPAVTVARTSTFYACVKKNGTARISTKKPRCARHETRISWSARGPAGRNGANGANGLGGATGASGTNGKDGASGANGASGTDGVNGKDGQNGTNGTDGTNGTAGLNGTNGIDGTNGTNGTNGSNGANGAVAGFATAPMTEGVTFTSASEGSPQTIVSIALPAGSFIANAKVEALLSDTKAGGFAGVRCRLVDTPSGGVGGAFDTAGWASLINVSFVANVAQTTLPLTLPVDSSSRPSTLSLICWVSVKEPAGGTLTAEANNAAITAVQTSGNS
ncbi:MAG TPA: hypothetical protein VGN13_08610 [Solirubrobacteraceae bacterium]|jgi:hypothetical protein